MPPRRPWNNRPPYLPPTSMGTLNRVSTLIEGRRIGGESAHLSVTGDWRQGRTRDGGLISTPAVRATRDLTGVPPGAFGSPLSANFG